MTVSATRDFYVGIGACGLEATITALKINQYISCGGGRCHSRIVALEISRRKGY